MTHLANSRPSDCIAAHYKIVPIKIADKLAIKICDKNGMYRFYFASCMNIIFNELHQQRVKYDVHTTRKIKLIHAIFL